MKPEAFLLTYLAWIHNHLRALLSVRDDVLFFLSVVEEVKPLRRLHVHSLLELQRLRESSGSAAEAEAGYRGAPYH